ncbi:hypothetical protein CFAEC_07450 [Corynebacterium faecale]|uniref:hypothetical protein n=1 Tax=Corynebacterium faecale TaxID=1758466 RepID=UPI0025B3CF28|nr:hypothetical protein [Corynebacterium faecale]WJY92314.1 hypothetical protein CFAEC_07450 [Corynebacterium faecale]
MNAKQRRIRYQADPGANTDRTADGRDYMVSYFLNEYQRGSMVMRFASPPGAADLVNELQKYGLSSALLKNVSATPVADVKDQGARYAQAQRATEDAQAHSRSLHSPSQQTRTDAQQRALNRNAIRQQASEWPSGNQGQQQWDTSRTGRTSSRKGGVLGPLLGIMVVFYGFTAAIATDSYNDGAFAAIVDVPFDSGFGDKVEACVDSLERRASDDLAIYGENPGLFEDRPSTFFPHPANAAFITGCLVN